MKKNIACIALATILPAVTLAAPAKNAQLAELGTLLPMYFEGAPYSEQAKIVFDNIGQYDEFLSRSFARKHGTTIDVILQHHSSISAGPAEMHEVVASQDSVYALLAKGRYAVIGDEGIPLAHVTKDSLVVLILQETKRSGILIGEQEARTMLDRMPAEDGATRFLFSHPGAPVVGTEINDVNILHDMLHTAADMYGMNVGLDRLILVLSDLRSEIAVAKMLNAMNERKTHRAAMVIGLRHEEYLRTVCTREHIKCTFLQTQ